MKRKWSSVFFLLLGCGIVCAENAIPAYPEYITESTGDSYQGSIDVSITHDAGAIRAKIETDDLILTSLSWVHFDDYVQLFGDPIALEKYADGIPWTREEVEMAMQVWGQRWEVSQDPFSAFAIFLKQPDGPLFIGHMVLGHGLRYGQSELAFLFKPQYRSVGFATQAITAILQGYAPQIVDQYLVNLNSTAVSPGLLRTVHATARFDDTFSIQAMIRAGMKIGTEEVLWDAVRFHYLITVDQILNRAQWEEEFLIEGAD